MDEQQPGVPLLYANWLHITPGPFDLAIDFGYQMAPADAQPGARVVLTWENAKLLRDAMDQIVDRREGNRGEIHPPAEVQFRETEIES